MWAIPSCDARKRKDPGGISWGGIEPHKIGTVEVRALLGSEVKYDKARREISISQREYMAKVVEKHYDKKWGGGKRAEGQLQNEGRCVAKEEYDYRSCVGALNYLVAMTRPDLA